MMDYRRLMDYHSFLILIISLIQIDLFNGSLRSPGRNYSINKSLDPIKFTKSFKNVQNVIPKFQKRGFKGRRVKCPSLCLCASFSMSCTGNKLHRLPIFINQNLETFVMRKTRLSGIKQNDFNRMFALQEIHLDCNKINSIDGWSFRGLVNLEVLDLSNNRLIHLETTIFRYLVQTKELYLDHNRLVDVEGVISYLANLVILGLSNNKMRSITNNTFYGNSMVTKLDLSHNLIRFIDRNAFSRMKSLNMLLLNENPIAQLDLSLEFNLELEQLDLTKCHLKRVVRDTPTQLKDLRLSNNRISSISDSDFISPNAVRVLLLSGNRIKKLSDYVFNYMPHLQDLHINKNKLKRLPSHMPKKLYAIYASHNRIRVLNSKPFRKKYKLKYVFLNFNNISRIESGAFRNLPKLKQVDLSHNNIKKISSDLFWRTENLEILDLSFNPIHVLEPDCFLSLSSLHIFKASSVAGSPQMDVSSFRDLPNLQYLDLSDSPIIVFKLITEPNFGADISSVQHLNIMNNGLSRLPHQIREVLQNLTYVNMIHNPWHCDKNILWLADWIRDNSVNFYEASKILCSFPSRLKDRKLLQLSKEEVKKLTKKRKKKRKTFIEEPSNLDDVYEETHLKQLNETLIKLEKYIYGIIKSKFYN